MSLSLDAGAWGLIVATFLACVVEMVEATTIVLAMGYTRGWRATLLGSACALALLAVVTSIAGYSLTRWLPQSALQLAIGGLLLIFGLQWLRKAILRAAGRKAQHDEDQIYRDEVAAAQAAGSARARIDPVAFVVSFKGVFLEGMEVVFIVITFGLNAHRIPLASAAAGAAVLLVLLIAVAARRPLAAIPENLLKYFVSLLLASFGTFWSVEGLGALRAGRHSLVWPGGEWCLLALIAVWWGLSVTLIATLRRPRSAADREREPESVARAGGAPA